MEVVISAVTYAPITQQRSGIGTAITTHNRQPVLDKALGHPLRYLPAGALVDHADGVTVEQHPDNQPRNERRRAWRLALLPAMR